MDNTQGGLALLVYRPGAHGDGWCFPASVSVMLICDVAKAEQTLAGWQRNGHVAAIIEWGPDLEGNQLLDAQEPTVPAIDNHRVRKALGLPVRYFECDDDGVCWYIVAVNLEHAREILRRNCDAFGQEGVPYDKATLSWKELTDEQAAKPKCHRDDGVEAVTLGQCHLGEAFCSEW